jgi:predicted nucleic acid-binding protein
MNLFIDTNVLLSFYHLSSDDLEELNKLRVLLEGGEVVWFSPDQVIQEFQRNRESRISDALSRLRQQRLSLQFPQFCEDYPEYEALRRLQRDYERSHSDLIQKVEHDASANALKADETIARQLKQVKQLKSTLEVIKKSRLRIEIGNPPGKGGSLGDAINWELLLESIPDGEDLYLITDDRDYFSLLNDTVLKEFLATEWKDRKASRVFCYRQLSHFFKDHFPDIKLATELEKEVWIRKLAGSGTFAATHRAISRLSAYSDFTATQRNDIVDAAVSNNQINLIISDADVSAFLESIIEGYEDHIEPVLLEVLRSRLAPRGDEPRPDDGEMPF